MEIEVKFIATERQLTNFFIKPLAKVRFFFFRNDLGILDLETLS